MKRMLLRFGIVTAVLAAAGIGLWIADPDYARLWSRLVALAEGGEQVAEAVSRS